MNKANGSNRFIGQQNEVSAINFLIEKGYKIITQNFYFGHGEIDIVAVKEKIIIFVEVKSRKSDQFGTPEKAVNRKKIALLMRTADGFLSKNSQFSTYEKRMDVISILHSEQKTQIDHYENITQLLS